MRLEWVVYTSQDIARGIKSSTLAYLEKIKPVLDRK